MMSNLLKVQHKKSIRFKPNQTSQRNLMPIMQDQCINIQGSQQINKRISITERRSPSLKQERRNQMLKKKSSIKMILDPLDTTNPVPVFSMEYNKR